MRTHINLNARNFSFLLLILISTFLTPLTVRAFPVEHGKVKGSFDTNVTFGSIIRTERPDPSIIGVGNGGNATSVNADDGTRNYSRGFVSNTAQVTHELGLRYESYGMFLRANYFVDFLNLSNGDLTSNQRDGAGRQFQFLDAFIKKDFNLGERKFDIRVGQQVLNWGESVFIQNGINVINPVNLTLLRLPSSELKQALIPTPMVSGTFDLAKNLSLEAFYLFEADEVIFETCGTFFSTSDIACRRSQEIVYGGYGQFPDGTPQAALQIQDPRYARDQGQTGVALRYFSPELNDSEFGLYFINYHSRIPFVSATSVGPGATPQLFTEYPEDILLFGASVNTQFGNGIAFQAEYSFRPNQPFQKEQNQVIAAGAFAPFAQVPPATMPGQEITGYKRLDVGQLQGTLTKNFGSENPFYANDWLILGEAAFTNVFGFPNPGVLSFEAPNTDLPPVPLPGAPGVQQGGYADKFSWGYVILTRLNYNQAINAVNLAPSLTYTHNVNGTSPGPGGNFIEGRKSLTMGVRATYLESWTGDLNYTRFFGAGANNVLRDRDFVSIVVGHAF